MDNYDWSRRHAEDMKVLEENDKYFEGTPSTPRSASTRPASSSTNIVTPTGFAPYFAQHQNTSGDPSTPTPSRFMANSGRASGTQWPPPGRLGSGSGPSSMQPPPTLPDPSRKRHRDSNGSSDEPAAKSLRATPSPALTGTTTPSSLDSLEMDENSELFRLLGNTTQDMRDLRREQKVEEAALRAKQEQERKDAEFARELDESMRRVNQERPSSQSAPSQSSFIPAQSYFDDHGRIQRRRPQAPLTPSSKSSPPSLFKQEPGRSAHSNLGRSNFNRPDTRPASIPRNAEFIDLDNDDELDELFNEPASHPSSDLVEIGQNDYRGSLGSSTQHGLPRVKREPNVSTINGVDGLPDRNQPSRAAAGWGHTAGNMLQTGMSVAQNIYDTGRQMLSPYDPANSQISVYGVPTYGMAGSSANPISFSDQQGYGNFSGVAEAFNALNSRVDVSDPRRQDLVRNYMERADYLNHDPGQTTEELKALLENIRPDEELDPQDREGTPDAMKNPLYEHQKLGLAWLIKMEEGSNKGGILADDMGLGKTIQALALMVSRRSKDPGRKTTLIVAPVALMRQWEKEIQNKVKSGREHRLTTFIMHGTHRSATWEQLKTYDVVLTTFGTLGTEVKRKQGIDMAKRANPNWRPTGKADRLPLLGDECKWYRVIIDEAQCIKNKNTHSAIGASYLQALSRFCMTGTPMMNNVGELYSLIRFLRIKPYDSPERFNRDFTKPLKSRDGDTVKAMRMLQALLKAILLRRTKKSTIDGKPILNLPERTTEAQEAAFTDEERAFYQAVETRTQLQFNKYLKAGTVGRNYSNVLVLLLRLRQACCHPHLLKDFGQPSGVTELSLEQMIDVAKELAPDVVARLQEQTGTEELNGLECPVCFDTAENGLIIIPCGHSTCTECFARITDPAQAIANGNGDAANDAKCPNCRGKIDLRRVITHEAFKKAHMPGLDLGLAALEGDSETDDESETEDKDSDSDSGDDLKDFIVDDDVVDEAETTDGSDDEAKGYRKGKTPFEKSATHTKSKKPKKDKGKGKARAADKPAKPKKSLAELKKASKEGQRNAKAHRKYIARLRKEYEPSSKIERTVDLLRATQESKEGEKTIIFSQFTSLLDLLEVPIDAAGWNYKRYDGSMSAKARDEAVTEFTEKENCKIMLISLKAGNAGLNLVAASQVIMIDPFWNPYIEEQAIDRAHRIGQLRPVKVHRILVPDTVEDRILDLQRRKRELIEGALDENASRNISRLGTRELAFLFGVPHN